MIAQNAIKSDALSDYSPDIFAMMMLLIAANLHLMTGSSDTSLVFMPNDAYQGEYWRYITHPFVHLSWYHLMLDASAFFILYSGLAEQAIIIRLFYVLISGAFSLNFALWFAPETQTYGLCGLSGIAHGLMAISSLEMMREKETFNIGAVSLIALIAKSIYEVITGQVFFEFLYFGLCGTPIIACHTGGLVGGIAGYLIKKTNFGS